MSLCCFSKQDGQGVDKGTTDENGLSSDDYTLSPSDEEFEHTLDCAPSPPAASHSCDGQKERSRGSKGESRGTPVAAPAEEESEEARPTAPFPVPKPRLSRQPSPQSPPPKAKPRTIHLFNPSAPEAHSPATPTKEASKAAPDSRPKQSLQEAAAHHRGEEPAGESPESQRRLGLRDARGILLLLLVLGHGGRSEPPQARGPGRAGGGGLLEQQHHRAHAGEEEPPLLQEERDAERPDQRAVQVLPLEPLVPEDQQRHAAQRPREPSRESG